MGRQSFLLTYHHKNYIIYIYKEEVNYELAAIDAIMEGQRNVMIGIDHDEVVYVPFTKAIKNDKPIKKDLVNVLRELSI